MVLTIVFERLIFCNSKGIPREAKKYVDSGAPPLSCQDKFVCFIFKELKTSQTQSFKILEGRRKGKGEGMEIEGLMLFLFL